MRLTTVILIATFLQVSANGFAQKITLSKRNAPLKTIFKELRNQSGYVFLCTENQLKISSPVTINVNGEDFQDVLKQIFENQPLTYNINEKTITIKEKERSIIDKVIDYFSNIDVSGKVVDENGQPIAGATIKVKGTTSTTISDGSGTFSLKNISEDAVLEISYLGYQNKEIKASKDLGILKMELTVGKLQEVTVNAGYYSVKEKELTGSISRITSKDIENQPVTNILATMQGRMPGVSIIQTTGVPGGGFDVKIRGQNSLRSEGNSPLYIIDGVPYASDPIGYNQTSTSYPNPTSPLNSIDPNNIESIEVLKDADATAIYGSRGANGVILISTKKGKAGKTKFSFNTSTGISKVARFMNLMNTEEYLAMRKQAFINDKISNFGVSDYDVNGTWDQNRNTDWQKELIGKAAHMTEFQGSVSGGSEKTQFLLSASYRNESTVFAGEFPYKKGGSQFSLNHRSDDNKFRLSLSASYTAQNNEQPAFDFTNDARTLAPNAPALYNADGSLNWENATWQNPLRNLNAKFNSKTSDLVANTVVSYEILPNLFIKTSVGFTTLSTTETRTAPSTVFNPIYNVTSASSGIIVNNTHRSSWIAEPQINWSKSIGAGKFDVLVGATFQNQITNTLYQTGDGFSSNSLIYSLAAASFKGILLDDETQYKYQAFFGRLNYNWKQRYIINFTARRDGSSRFGPGNQFSKFGAVGAAWLFSNEDFLKANEWLSFGKLRSSYGITGNDQIGDYQFLNTYTTSGVNYNGITGLQPSRLYNENFAWETNKKLEIALELGFLKDRISTSVAWYQNRSSNQLVGVPLPGTTGFKVLQSNLDAVVENKGLELTLRTVNLSVKDFSWTTSFNLTFVNNKLLKFPNLEGSSYSQQYRVGQPLNILLLYNYQGIDPQKGTYQFEDLDKDGKISFPNDQQIVSDMSPKYYGGFQNQLSYKQFSLDFIFQFVNQKNRFYPMGLAGQMSNQSIKMLNSWHNAGDNTDFQLYTTGTNSSAVTAGNLFTKSNASIDDASFIRLKNIAISWDVPLKLKETKCRIMLQGQNLLTITNYKDGDPEFITHGYLSPLKVITAGIQLTL
ncbi:MAG: SusC/RagA family TonB-linked outer membrane protein [Flavobacterium sp.]|nr:MAG: SusC/RagA family TonB-linked outer membrane protein [Flavobacterium sp.]